MVTKITSLAIEEGAVTSATIASGAVTVEKIYVEGISAAGVTTATNLADGAANRIAYQQAVGQTTFVTAPTTATTYLQWNGVAFTWASSVGPQGPQGPSGANGTIGVDGATGPQGPTGPNNIASISGQANTATSYIALPIGTTEQRPGTPFPGIMRYNTSTGYAEVYTPGGWAIIGAPPPSISSITPVTFNGEQGTTFTINGANFTNDAIVKFITNGNVEYTAGTVVFINSSQLTATTPRDFTVSEEPLDVKVIQASGSVTSVDVIDCGGTPTWSTSAGTLATVADRYGSYSPITSVSATDPDSSATISYSLISGSLPAGTSLNTSTGAISGDPTDVVSQTTSNFDLTATDNAGNTSTRSFSIIVTLAKDGSSSSRAATSAKAIYNLSSSFQGSSANGLYWIDPGGIYTGGPVQLYCDMQADGGGWILVFSYYKGQTPVSDVSAYYTTPQAAASGTSQTLTAVATPNDPGQSYCLPDNFWKAFGSEYTTTGEFREEYAITGTGWPNNSTRVVGYVGGRTSGGAAGNYLTATQLSTLRTCYGYNGRNGIRSDYWGSIARGGYTSNNLGIVTRYTGDNTGGATTLGVFLDPSHLNGDRSTGTTGTNTAAATSASWMGRGNCCGMGAGSANGSEPNGTRWGVAWIR
jgi:hypothetical protein